MGAYTVLFGIESGSKKTLKAMKKNWDLQMVKDKVRLLQKNGINVTGSFILGFSGELAILAIFRARIRKVAATSHNCSNDKERNYFGERVLFS